MPHDWRWRDSSHYDAACSKCGLADNHPLADKPCGSLVDWQCGVCGADEIMVDAYAKWNPKTQKLELHTTFDHYICGVCNKETPGINEVPYNGT